MKLLSTLTRANKANLDKLATYLENLPEGYKHFAMAAYSSLDTDDQADYALNNGGLQRFECGAVACAVGHGPSAGILFRKGKDGEFFRGEFEPDWDLYSARFVGSTASEAWSWCFSGGWEDLDNSHRGAAARIRYLLAGKDIPSTVRRVVFDGDSGLVDLYGEFVIKGDGHIVRATSA